MKQKNIEVEATVISNNRNNLVVELDNGHELKATLSGNMSRHKIKVDDGSRVLVSISPYSLERGIIKRRLDKVEHSGTGNQKRRKNQKEGLVKKGRTSAKKKR